MKTRSVVIVAMPNAMALDIICPSDVFHNANRMNNEIANMDSVIYDLCIASPSRELDVRTSSGLVIRCEKSIFDIHYPIDTLIIGGFSMDYNWKSQPELVNWIKKNHNDIRRVCAVCLGAFMLAEAGLLQNRRATTHWLNAQTLRLSYLGIQVNSDLIFIKDQNIYTSGGATAGIDLALALVEEDNGREVALKVAKVLVLYLKRPGNQSQFSDILLHQEASKKPILELQQWIKSNLREDLTVKMLSEKVFMSHRNFARVFLNETGLTPAKYVEKLRTECAKRLLEDSNDPIERIAAISGFKSVDTMRKIFVRNFSLTPFDYRNLFGRI